MSYKVGGGRHASSGGRVAVAMLGKETKVEKNHSMGDKKRKSDGKGASAVKFIKEIKERTHQENTSV